MMDQLRSWPLLIALNVACTAARYKYYSPNSTSPLTKRLRAAIQNWEDDVDFSGVSVEDGKWWVWISATFDHASTSHAVNNMVMLASFAPQLEDVLARAVASAAVDGSSSGDVGAGSRLVGALLLWALFVATGAAGWLLTLRLLKHRHRGEDWAFAARYQVSLGSSPATYGMLAFLAVTAPGRCVCRTFGLPAWAWVTALACGPQLFSEKYGVQWWRIKITRPDTLIGQQHQQQQQQH